MSERIFMQKTNGYYIYLHSLTPAAQSQNIKNRLSLDYTAFFKLH